MFITCITSIFFKTCLLVLSCSALRLKHTDRCAILMDLLVCIPACTIRQKHCITNCESSFAAPLCLLMWCYQLARDQCIFLGVFYRVEKKVLYGNHVCRFVCNLISALKFLGRFFLIQWRLSLKHIQFLASAILNHNRTYFTQSHTWTFINRPPREQSKLHSTSLWTKIF
jgi:hypothetical protein